jgi:hypothetical protein
VPAGVIVEVDVNVQPCRQPAPNLFDISIQVFLRIVSARGWSVVPTDINEVCSDWFGNVSVAPIGKTERDPMRAQHVEYRRHKPGRVANFDHTWHLIARTISLQDCKENFQAFEIELEMRRQLKKDRSQPVSQMFRARKEKIQRSLRIFETLDMREKATCLDGEDKVRWNLISPVLERCFARQAIKAVIDLHRAEVLGKEL